MHGQGQTEEAKRFVVEVVIERLLCPECYPEGDDLERWDENCEVCDGLQETLRIGKAWGEIDKPDSFFRLVEIVTEFWTKYHPVYSTMVDAYAALRREPTRDHVFVRQVNRIVCVRRVVQVESKFEWVSDRARDEVIAYSRALGLRFTEAVVEMIKKGSTLVRRVDR